VGALTTIGREPQHSASPKKNGGFAGDTSKVVLVGWIKLYPNQPQTWWIVIVKNPHGEL